MSDPRPGADRSRAGPGDPIRVLAEHALDLLVYAPAGALLEVLDDPVAMAGKGRERIGRELRNAKVVGRLAVDLGKRQAQHRLQDLLGSPGGTGTPGGPVGGGGTWTAADRPAGGPTSPGDATGKASRHGASVARDPAVDLAIPDYDTLSASQVVRRLDGLGPAELRSVMAHELSGRGRRTIVTRCEQLLSQSASGGGRSA